MNNALLVLISVAQISALQFGISRDLPLETGGSADTSFCVLSDWTTCAAESVYRCSKSQTLKLLPINQQSSNISGKVSCNGNAGQVTTQTCMDGNCPQWVTGNWTECPSNCTSQLPPWEGFQTRSLVCQDATGVVYQNAVCEGIHGLSLKPIAEQACPCSHQSVPYDPYGIRPLQGLAPEGQTTPPGEDHTTIIPLGDAGYVVLRGTPSPS